MNYHSNYYPQWQALPAYNLHVYFPHQYNNPYYQKAYGWHTYSAQSQLPYLHPALAAATTRVRYDLRQSVQDGITFSTYQQIGSVSALARPVNEVRIISKAFPWVVDVRLLRGVVVTCGAIFQALYAMLQEPIADSEWGIVVQDVPRRQAIENAAKARCDKGDKDTRLKRIDWLGERTAFKGLERDEEFQKKRLLPGMQACKETWVVKFGKP